jgi:mxaL protein
VFFTDGHEAPPLRDDFAPVVPDDATDPHGIILGVGGDALRPIPKFDPTGQPIGVWGADEVLQAPPRGSSEPSSSASSERSVAIGTEHLSSLKQAHLRELAALTGLDYVRLEPSTDVAEVLQERRSSRTRSVPTDVRAPLEAAALVLLLLAVGPNRRPARRLAAAGQSYLIYRKR